MSRELQSRVKGCWFFNDFLFFLVIFTSLLPPPPPSSSPTLSSETFFHLMTSLYLAELCDEFFRLASFVVCAASWYRMTSILLLSSVPVGWTWLSRDERRLRFSLLLLFADEGDFFAWFPVDVADLLPLGGFLLISPSENC